MGVPCDDVGLQQCFFHEPWRACRTWLAGEVQGRPDPVLLRRVLRKNLLVVASTLMRQRVGGMVLCSNIGKSCPTVRVSVAATVCVCAGMCVCVYMCICACVCMCVYVCLHALVRSRMTSVVWTIDATQAWESAFLRRARSRRVFGVIFG